MVAMISEQRPESQHVEKTLLKKKSRMMGGVFQTAAPVQ